jgi:hypothetical protein
VERELRREKQRQNWLMSQYNLTVNEFEYMKLNQDGNCASCGLKPSGKGPASVLHVDHDHVTGDVRGLLCFSCNTALGMLRDSSVVINQLLNYKESYNAL